MFQDYHGDRAPEQLTKEFGPKFAQALFQLKPRSWQGADRVRLWVALSVY